MTNKVQLFRIESARVLSLEPLTLRIPAGNGVSLCLDGGNKTPYTSDEDVHVVVEGGSGSAVVPPLPQEKDEFGPYFTDFVFFGAASVIVKGTFLQVETAGTVFVTLGEGALPASLTAIRDATTLEWSCVDGIEPHRP
jgi:hypothetical protein